MLRLLITLAIVAAPVVYGYSAGAPSGACSDGVPQVGFEIKLSI